jgi:hypothetical protein
MGKSNGNGNVATPRGTEYVVLRREAGSTTWAEYPNDRASFTSVSGGVGAIKKAAKRKGTDDVYEPGRWKAVPVGTWDSETNNWETETEERTVSKVIKPSRPKREKVA